MTVLGESIEWGLIPNNSWSLCKGCELGKAIIRVAPRLKYSAANVGDLPIWHRDGAEYWMDLGLTDFDRRKIRSLAELASMIQEEPTKPALLEELDFVADRMLFYLHQLVSGGHRTGLIAPQNVIVVVRQLIDYPAAAKLRMQLTRGEISRDSLSELQISLVNQAPKGRLIVFSDLGFISPPDSSNLSAWLDREHEFRFLWDRDPQQEHVALPDHQRVNRTAARIFAWCISGRKLRQIPPISATEPGVVGPCWDVLREAIEGKFETIEIFRKRLHKHPLSTHAFGRAISLSQPVSVAPTETLKPTRTSKKFYWAMLGLVPVILLAAFLLVFIQNDPKTFPVCCPEVQRAGAEGFYDLLLTYDTLTQAPTSILQPPQGATASDSSTDDGRDLVSKYLAELEHLASRLAVVEELHDPSLVAADGSISAAQSECLEKLRANLIREFKTNISECRDLSKKEGIIGVELAPVVIKLDGLTWKLFELGPYTHLPEAKELKITLETLVLNHKHLSGGYTFHFNLE